MQSNGTRIVALLVALAVVVALFFAFRGGDDDSPTGTDAATTTATTGAESGGERERRGDDRRRRQNGKGSIPTIEVVDGRPRGGVAELEFEEGEKVRFAVTSDAADEVHVHGYDIEGPVGAGETAEFDFPADLEGVFEVELHHSGEQIAELTINP